MNRLSCNVTNCVNNTGGLCSARVIHITGINADIKRGTECETFRQNDIVGAIKEITNMNIGGQINQYFQRDRVVMSPEIVCDAIKCIYNINRSCSADFIQIYGPASLSNGYTRCETFSNV